MKKIALLLITILCISEIFAEGAKYLIIAPDNFVQSLQPLADWKTKKGVKAMIVPLSVTGNTAAQVKNYILNAYNNWEIRPEYILLAGHGTVVPYFTNSDDYFANMDSNYQIELSIGRFPCVSINKINTVVTKTLSYERAPFIEDTTWFKKGTTIVREDGSPFPDTVYWNTVRYIFGLWQSASYIYIDTFARLHGNNAQNVESAITDGRAFVVYSGDGVTNWWSPFVIDTARMNNGFKLPIIISTSCTDFSFTSLGYIGDKTLNTGTPQSPRGVAAFFGTTRVGVPIAVYRGIVANGFFRSVFLDGIYKLGDATKRAKYIIDSIQPSGYSTSWYQEWNLLGDPELNLWTAVPKPLTVTYDSVITPNPTNVTVTVMSNGVPVPNALVCLMKDTTIYIYENTDSNGIKVFLISPQDTGTISITVTGRNCHPFEGIIRVLSSGVEENRSPLSTVRLSLKVFPNPAKNYFAVRLPQTTDRIKIFDVSGKVVKEIRYLIVDVASTPSTLRVRPTQNDNTVRVSLDGIKDGVYIIKLGNETKKLVVNK